MPYTITSAHGAEVQIGNGASSETFTEIQGVHNGPNGLEETWNTIQARHHGSTATYQKRTFKEPASLTFDLFYDSTDTQHIALMTSARNGTRKNYKLIITDQGAEQAAFAAYASVNLSAQPDAFNVYSVTLTIDGEITYS